MDNLTLPHATWFASDSHLSEHRPLTVKAFQKFLGAALIEAKALVLLGDIFDSWVGDDIISGAKSWLLTTLALLKRCTEQFPVWLVKGNRDFLIGEKFVVATGVQILPQDVLFKTSMGVVLLSHGDKYCVDDVDYQKFRVMVSQPEWQKEFLKMPISERLKIAARTRNISRTATSIKQAGIMDVNLEVIRKVFSEKKANIMIHGHTHRPGCYSLTADNRVCKRWVLPDWDHDSSFPVRSGWIVLNRCELVVCA